MSNNEVLSSTILAKKRHEMRERGGVNWLIDLFIDEFPNYLNELQQAITTNDGEALFLAAHKFKGSCSNLGAVGMVALCKKIRRTRTRWGYTTSHCSDGKRYEFWHKTIKRGFGIGKTI